MNFIRKFVLPVAGVAAIALLIAIASPRAVHAVTAALVQIVNNPTTAVPMVQAPAATQIYRHTCWGVFNNGFNSDCTLPSVPPQQTLFVEAVAVRIETAGIDPREVTFRETDSQDLMMVLPMYHQAATPMGVDAYAGNAAMRMSFPAGHTPYCHVALAAATTYGNLTCSVSGYLAPAQ